MSASEFTPSIGRIVHYVDTQYQCRAAIIVAVYDSDEECTLQVFECDDDGSVLIRRAPRGKTVAAARPGPPGTWHVPERM